MLVLASPSLWGGMTIQKAVSPEIGACEVNDAVPVCMGIGCLEHVHFLTAEVKRDSVIERNQR